MNVYMNGYSVLASSGYLAAEKAFKGSDADGCVPPLLMQGDDIEFCNSSFKN